MVIGYIDVVVRIDEHTTGPSKLLPFVNEVTLLVEDLNPVIVPVGNEQPSGQSDAERNPGWMRGIRVGSALDGSVSVFIPDPDFDPRNPTETSAHGIAADADGNIYGAEVPAETLKKYVRTR